jgi:hypothetical protein
LPHGARAQALTASTSTAMRTQAAREEIIGRGYRAR